LPEDWHVALHVDVVGRHVDDILKIAATGGQDKAEIFPRSHKLLLLRVFDDRQIARAANLTRAVESLPDAYRWRITRTLAKQFHVIWNDDLAISHGRGT
jgi:hypothetical protein